MKKILSDVTKKEGADAKKFERQYTTELSNFEQALSELEALHDFYVQSR